MATIESVRERPLEELVDSRICPAEQIVHWDQDTLSNSELALMNHTHGVISDYIVGPEEVKIAIGIRTLGELEDFSARVEQDLKSHIADYGPRFGMRALRRSMELRRITSTGLDNLNFENKQSAIIPFLVSQYSKDFVYPEGVVDLGAIEQLRAADRQAVRSCMANDLHLTLRLHIDRLLFERRMSRTNPEVSLELSDDDIEVTGQLTGIHHDLDTRRDWLEIQDGDRRRRIAHKTVRTLGITIPETLQTD